VTRDQQNGDERGALRTDQNQLIFGQGFSFSGYERDPLYMNVSGQNGARRFLDISGVSGIDSITDGRAGVFADFDNDGDLDVFMTTIQGQSHLLFRNNVGQGSNFLRVVIEGGERSGRDAFGTIVRVRTSAGTQTKIKDGGSGFISQHDPRLHFGLGRDERAEWVEVTWPNGRIERFAGEARAGTTIVLREGAGRIETITVGRAQLPDPLTRSEAFARGLRISVGRPLPDFVLRSVEGNSQTSMQNVRRNGRRMLINVWATWCAPCAREMPELERLRTRLAARGIDLVGLNVDAEPNADVRGYLRERRVGYPNYIGGVTAIENIYATDEMSVPLTIVVDERGLVAELIPGWSDQTQARFAALAGGDGENPTNTPPAQRRGGARRR
jgi:thiol-disulfide isomerase/thioredoxin